MNRTNKLTKLAIVGLGAVALLLADDGVHAADHAEAPGAGADPAADIADFYAWHTDNDTLVAVVTFAGLGAPGDAAVYDNDVLYGIHIDTDFDHEPDTNIWCRFGDNGLDAADENFMRGVQCLNVPGAAGPLEGPVDGDPIVDADNENVKAWAGLREDPFFFDLTGYQETLDTGTIAFDSNRDDFAGTNVTAIVIEMDAAAAAADGTQLQIWATTGRL